MKISEENKDWLESQLRSMYGHSVVFTIHESAIKEKLLADQQRIDELEKENAELKSHLSQYGNLIDLDDMGECVEEVMRLHSETPKQSLAQHDKEVIESFVKECKNSDKLTGIEKLTLHALMIKHFQFLEQLQEQE